MEISPCRHRQADGEDFKSKLFLRRLSSTRNPGQKVGEQTAFVWARRRVGRMQAARTRRSRSSSSIGTEDGRRARRRQATLLARDDDDGIGLLGQADRGAMPRPDVPVDRDRVVAQRQKARRALDDQVAPITAPSCSGEVLLKIASNRSSDSRASSAVPLRRTRADRSVARSRSAPRRAGAPERTPVRDDAQLLGGDLVLGAAVAHEQPARRAVRGRGATRAETRSEARPPFRAAVLHHGGEDKRCSKLETARITTSTNKPSMICTARVPRIRSSR